MKSNIILIGMPSAGKTTIGKMIAEALNRPFYDLDDLICTHQKMSIPDIFAKFSEEYFREIESLCVRQIANYKSIVLSTGGGTIKRKENIDFLKENGLIFFIDRDLDRLVSDDPNRPLSSSKEAISKLYEERYPLYQKYADAIISNNEEIKQTAEEIIAIYQKYCNK